MLATWNILITPIIFKCPKFIPAFKEQFYFIYFFKNIYLFRLRQVLVAACRLFGCGMYAGSHSLTRDRTQAPCIGAAESYPLDHQGCPERAILNNSYPFAEGYPQALVQFTIDKLYGNRNVTRNLLSNINFHYWWKVRHKVHNVH